MELEPRASAYMQLELSEDVYYEIFTFLDSLGASRYLLHGGVYGCNTCNEEYIDFIRLDANEGWVSDFSYTIFDRGFSSLIDVSTEADTLIKVNYFGSDLNEGCGCYSEEMKERIEYKETESPLNCYLLFRYSHYNFNLVESRAWYQPITEENY